METIPKRGAILWFDSVKLCRLQFPSLLTSDTSEHMACSYSQMKEK